MNFWNGYNGRSTYLHGISDDTRDSKLSGSTILAYMTISAAFVYYLLIYLDFSLLPLPEMLWNCLIYIVPSPMLTALDHSAWGSGSNLDGQVTNQNASKGHAAKSATLRKILGLNRGGLLAGLQRTRNMTGIPTIRKETQDDRPPGLGNWDNSCYQNSVIQGLASLRSLSRYLSTTISELDDAKNKKMNSALRDIITELNDPSNNGQRIWTPPELKSMSSWQQQDAQEYFSKVLDEIDKEILHAARGKDKGLGLLEFSGLELSGKDMRSRMQAEDTKDSGTGGSGVLKDTERVPLEDSADGNVSGSLASSLLHNPLEGLLAQRVGCMRCGYAEGLSLVPFNCITVSLGKSWLYDVRDCLDEYTALEPIEGVECAKCTLLRSKEQIQRLLRDTVHENSNHEGVEASVVPDEIQLQATARLDAVNAALEEEDFSEKTLINKCKIPSRSRVASTKSRQAVIGRAPKALIIHVNRSVFDEYSGVQRKNHADVKFPKTLDLGPWCLGTQDKNEDSREEWVLDPAKSMLAGEGDDPSRQAPSYDLRGVVTHYGRHENGHYICYRKHDSTAEVSNQSSQKDLEGSSDGLNRWWRLSDDDVSMVSEQHVLEQGSVFMLFYEQIERLEVALEFLNSIASSIR
ncbi:MAG: hypothetical protein M1827_001520 [Pycnora praestabilis]|nr:MAG: hypothetical protein M1827_001520 [Pycnora praestabilis]